MKQVMSLMLFLITFVIGFIGYYNLYGGGGGVFLPE